MSRKRMREIVTMSRRSSDKRIRSRMVRREVLKRIHQIKNHRCLLTCAVGCLPLTNADENDDPEEKAFKLNAERNNGRGACSRVAPCICALARPLMRLCCPARADKRPVTLTSAVSLFLCVLSLAAAMLGITGCLLHELLGVNALYPTGGMGGDAPPEIF